MAGTRDDFLKLCADLVEKIDAIDKQTPWAEAEPGWWLDMMAMKTSAQTAIRLHSPAKPAA